MSMPPGRVRLNVWVIVLILSALVLGVPGVCRFVACLESARLESRGDFTKVPLDLSPSLRDVSETIVFNSGVLRSGSDDCWMGVTFKDARQIERDAKYFIYVPGMSRTLVLDKKKMPIGGPDERAFLGLLQRWYRQDSEVRELRSRLDRRDPSGESLTMGGLSDETDQLTGQQRGKIIADCMMRVLLKRNKLPVWSRIFSQPAPR